MIVLLGIDKVCFTHTVREGAKKSHLYIAFSRTDRSGLHNSVSELHDANSDLQSSNVTIPLRKIILRKGKLVLDQHISEFHHVGAKLHADFIDPNRDSIGPNRELKRNTAFSAVKSRLAHFLPECYLSRMFIRPTTDGTHGRLSR